MKIFNFLIFVLISIAIFASSIIAQTEGKLDVASGKIASVNQKAFDNGNLGIKELTFAYDKLEAELKPQIEELKTLHLELQKLQAGIENYQKVLATEGKIGCYEPIIPKANAKYEEYEKRFLNLMRKQESYKLLQEKRELEIITPIKNKIGDALKQFAKEKGYSMIFDISNLAAGDNGFSISYNDGIFDVTKEFVKFYNDYSEKQKAQ